MRSLNLEFSDLPGKLVEISGIASRDQVLDIGCGPGRMLSAFSEAARHVVGVDKNARFLERAVASNQSAIDTGRLDLLPGDIEQGLPFATGAFDVVINQNVMECVADKRAAIQECRRVLRPGGILVLGHHDFDATILNSDDCELTRRMIHAYADHIQDWMQRSDGQMGRKLPGLMRDAGFTGCETETICLVELDLTPDSYARSHLASMASLAGNLDVEPSEADQWFSSIEALARHGEFYFAVPWIYVRGVK